MIKILGLSICTCKSRDSVYVDIYSDVVKKAREAVCRSCFEVWPDWYDLVFSEENRKKSIRDRLIPILIETQLWGVEVLQPTKDEIPHYQLIQGLLNEALVVNFPALGLVGSVIEGVVKNEHIKIHSHPEALGLLDNRQKPDRDNLVRKKIFGWYANLLGLVLGTRELIVNGKKMGRGEILRLPKEGAEKEAKKLLHLVLEKTVDGSFAQTVFERLRF